MSDHRKTNSITPPPLNLDVLKSEYVDSPYSNDVPAKDTTTKKVDFVSTITYGTN